MYQKETVFILGAGASWHYGYPTGEDLVEMVTEYALQFKALFNHYESLAVTHSFPSSGFVPKHLVERHGFPANISHFTHINDARKAMKSFADECDDLAQRLRQVRPLVIDYFLSWNRSLEALAKMLIAFVLLETERKSLTEEGLFGGNINRHKILSNQRHPHHTNNVYLDSKWYKDDWYRFIVYKLASGCRTPKELLSNKFRVVTFNYDVSLERQLYNALSSIELFNQSKGLIREFLHSDRIVHVYGKLRANPYTDKEYGKIPKVDFSLGSGPKITTAMIDVSRALDISYDASQGINTIAPDKIESSITTAAVQDMLFRAEDCYILGFGFDENNVDLLGLPKMIAHHRDGTGPIPGELAHHTRLLVTNFMNINRVNKQLTKTVLVPVHKLKDEPYSRAFNNRSEYIEISHRDVYGALEYDFD